jgi:hypothetical protein
VRRITHCGNRSSSPGIGWISGAFALTLLAAAVAEAQGPVQRRAEPRVRPELRVDYVAAPDGVQIGAGAAVRMSTYVRVGAIAGVGPHFSDAVERFGWRADIFGRFQLDPFRERRWAPYAAAGVSIRGAGSESDEFLMALVGLEGPLARGWSPAIEVGLGGGFRAGLVMRRGGGRYR